MRRRGISFAVLTAITSSLVVAASASATYHENLIREVHDSSTPNSDYVVLQAYSAGQNFVSGRQVVTYDGGGSALSHVLLSNVPNGANQATILVGGTGVAGADATDPGFNVVNTGGTVCFAEGTAIISEPTGLDCVAYRGSNAATTFPLIPPASPYGTPLSLGGQDLTDKSIVRTISRGCPTLLDAADDTNNSAADFSASTTTNPRNNAAPITETPCPNPSTTPAKKKKCKKKKKHRSAEVAKKKKCKKKKKHR
jgi:hypothetical protein